jgi:hypothetical protein
MYVDKDVSITGTVTETETCDEAIYINKYSVHLKRGWNIIYANETKKGNMYEWEMTTTAPAGAKWYFYDDDENS